MLSSDPRPTLNDRYVHAKGDAVSSCPIMTKRCAEVMDNVGSPRSTSAERCALAMTDAGGQQTMSPGKCRLTLASVICLKRKIFCLCYLPFSNTNVAHSMYTCHTSCMQSLADVACRWSTLLAQYILATDYATCCWPT